MKAVVYEKYGPPEVLQIMEVKKPEPKDDEILIKIFATTVAAGDWRMRKADPFVARLFNGLLRPKRIKILGFELAGKVEEVGERVSSFKKGDLVYGFAGFGYGAYAEYICLPAKSKSARKGLVAHKPENLNYEEAAALPVGGFTALALLEDQNLEGKKILVYGASGSVGSYAVQLAFSFGAKVTGVCSDPNLELVRSLGASDVWDYTSGELKHKKESFDVVLDAVGKFPKSAARRFLKKDGVYLSAHGSAKSSLDHLDTLKEMVEAGEIKPHIDRVYTMEEIVEAHRYVESWRKRGNVVVKIV